MIANAKAWARDRYSIHFRTFGLRMRVTVVVNRTCRR